MALVTAWNTERFARAERLKPLKDYLPKDETKSTPEPIQSADEMLATLEQAKAAGAPMTIRKVG